MLRHATVLSLVTLTLVLLGLQGPPARSGEADKGKKTDPGKAVEARRGTTRERLMQLRTLHKVLEETLDTKAFQGPMILKEILGVLQDNLDKRYKDDDVLPILVDEQAFKEENPDVPSVLESQVRFPPFPRRMTVATALRVALAQVPTNNATFLVRAGYLEVTTRKQASPKQLLQRRVMALFDGSPLGEALDYLSALTGLSVTVDSRVGDKLKTPVTAAFTNDITLEAALRMLTNMSDLKMVLVGDAVYITSPANAQALEKEQRPREPEAGKVAQ